MNLATLAQRQAERYGDRLLALVNGEPVTYADLAGKSARFAAGLQALGIEPGDRVAVMMPTRPEFLYAWFGILAAGAIEVPIHDAARGPGIAYILDTTGARALVVDEEHVDHVADQIGGVESLERVIVTGPKPELDKPVEEFADLLARDPADVVERSPSDIASILFTGGTTGPPKGVALPHNHNLNLAEGVCEEIGYSEDDVIYSFFPLFHANAKYMTVLAAMVSGAKCVIHKRFSASRFWDICAEHGVTAFNGMGEVLRILLKQPQRDGDRTHSVRVVVGAAAAADLVMDFEERFGIAVLDAYGMTETGPTIMVPWDKRRPGAAGLPTPWYEVRLVDADDNDVPVGETGEIAVRPRKPFVMMERYWRNDAATLASMRNLWFHTGDNAYRDEDGFFWFVARGTDSIRRRGENVSAWEVERVLADHPELLEAAVYGVPSELGGQEVMVAVVRRPESGITPEDLLDYCTGKMPHFAVPRYVRFMDALPRSHAQRVLKPELKAAGTEAEGVWDREAVGYVVQR
jgi:crotonobetaine/carnitine-CoA ligase